MGRSKAPSLPIKALSFCRPTELRGKGDGASHQRGNAFPRPQGGCKGFRCPRQRHIKLPSEPARSVGRTHRSVRSTRTIEPGRRRAPEPSSPQGACPYGTSHQRGKTPKWYVKSMTHCFSPQIPRFPLRGSPAKRQRVYGAERRFDTPSLS